MKIPDLIAVFIPTSSGTTAQALAEVFVKEQPTTQVHIVQTTACHPIATALGATGEDTDSSVAGAIVDNIAHRKLALVSVIEQTHGKGWIVNDEEIEAAQKLVKQTTNSDISPNSALSVAGLKKALESKIKFEGAVACVITGM